MKKEDYPGLFVVIEGIDGTGKSTLAARLYSELKKQGLNCLLTFEPTKGEWGKIIRQSFTAKSRMDPQKEVELFLKDRKEHLDKTVIPALKDGRIVICDRYFYSTCAYQGARGLDFEKILKMNKEFAIEPDLCILLCLDPNEAIKRITKSRGDKANNFEGLEYLKKVSKIYDKFDDTCITRLDASLPPDQVLNVAKEKVLDALSKKS